MSPTFQPFQEEHQIFRQQVRAFAENELGPKVDQWEEDYVRSVAVSLLGDSTELQTIRLKEELARLRTAIIDRLSVLDAENSAQEERAECAE